MDRKKDKVITAFSTVIRKNLAPSYLLLFGSRAGNKFKKDSDYDFLIVSPKFRKWSWEERGARVYAMKQNIPAAMDILCYTPEEFERKKKQMGLVQQAVKEGIEI